MHLVHCVGSASLFDVEAAIENHTDEFLTAILSLKILRAEMSVTYLKRSESCSCLLPCLVELSREAFHPALKRTFKLFSEGSFIRTISAMVQCLEWSNRQPPRRSSDFAQDERPSPSPYSSYFASQRYAFEVIEFKRLVLFAPR